MARRVVCQVTKEIGTNETFYRGEKGKYYKNEEIYKDFVKRRDDRVAVIDHVCKLLGYEPGMKFPSVVTKKLKELEFYGFELVLETFKENEDIILWSLNNKEFKNENAKASYIFAIVINNINDLYFKRKREQKQEKIMNTGDIEVKCNELNLMDDRISTTSRRKNEKDLSSILEENGWI